MKTVITTLIFCKEAMIRTSCRLHLNMSQRMTDFQCDRIEHSTRATVKACRLNARLPTSASFNCVIFSVLILLAATANAFSITKSECDPDDIFSCDFGATCEREFGRSREAMSSNKPIYRCKCPNINCREAGLFDPVCGDSGQSMTTHFNELCLMMEECEKQRPIERVCYGMCKSPSCVAVESKTLQHGPCPRQNVGLCLNGGLCVHHLVLNESFCRCPSEYTGDRCQFKYVVGQTSKENKCNYTQQVLTIFAIVLLAVVLLLLIACVCLRNVKGKKEEEEKLWSREETSPLRESTRSDYLFPNRGRLGGGSEN